MAETGNHDKIVTSEPTTTTEGHTTTAPTTHIEKETAPHAVGPIHTPQAAAVGVEGENLDDEKVDLSELEDDTHDIFKPFPLLKGVALEENPLTIRAVLIGIVLGSLVNASNVYLGEHNSPPFPTNAH